MYRKSPGKNFSTERFLNAAGFSKVNLENLVYDLKQLHGISDAQVRVAKAAPKKAEKPKLVIAFEDIKNKTTEELTAFLNQEKISVPGIPSFSKGSAGNKERQQYVKDYNLVSESNKNKDLDIAIGEWIHSMVVQMAVDYLEPTPEIENIDIPGFSMATSKEEVFTTAPDEVKETVKLRDEFPFLNDPDCPEELYILVGKKFAHYNAYVKAHEALMVNLENEETIDGPKIPMTPEQIFEFAKTAVENFELNQDIYAELNHYKETGEILGKHPIFTERKLKESVAVMSVPDATKRMSNLENYIRRDAKKRDAKKTTPEMKEKLSKKIIGWEYELKIIKAKLGFSEK